MLVSDPPMNTTRFSRRSFLKRSAAGSLLLAQAGLLCEGAPVQRTAADQVTLGNTGVRLSRLGMGTGSDSGHIQRALGKEGFNSLVHYAFDHGITYFDCAQQYATFDWIGDAIKGLPREKLFIQSKINHQPEDILKEIDLHRKTFDTDYVDSLLVHCMIHKDWPETWKRVRDGYDQAQEKKWIRTKGVSCHSLVPAGYARCRRVGLAGSASRASQSAGRVYGWAAREFQHGAERNRPGPGAIKDHA